MGAYARKDAQRKWQVDLGIEAEVISDSSRKDFNIENECPFFYEKDDGCFIYRTNHTDNMVTRWALHDRDGVYRYWCSNMDTSYSAGMIPGDGGEKKYSPPREGWTAYDNEERKLPSPRLRMVD